MVAQAGSAFANAAVTTEEGRRQQRAADMAQYCHADAPRVLRRLPHWTLSRRARGDQPHQRELGSTRSSPLIAPGNVKTAGVKAAPPGRPPMKAQQVTPLMGGGRRDGQVSRACARCRRRPKPPHRPGPREHGPRATRAAQLERAVSRRAPRVAALGMLATAHAPSCGFLSASTTTIPGAQQKIATRSERNGRLQTKAERHSRRRQAEGRGGLSVAADSHAIVATAPRQLRQVIGSVGVLGLGEEPR